MTAPLMIIDDDDDLRDVMASIMVAAGYDVAAYADAREALAALARGPTPFLILLDLMMPRMSGWEFREAQLRDPALAAVPVVVVTAAGTLGDDARALAGLETVRKPFSLETALAVVARYAPHVESRA